MRRSRLFRVVLVFICWPALAFSFASVTRVRLRTGSGGCFPGLGRNLRAGGQGCDRERARWHHRERDRWHRGGWHHRERDGIAWKHGLLFAGSRGGRGLRSGLRNREGRDGDRDEEEERGFFHEARWEGMEQARRCCCGVPWGLTPPLGTEDEAAARGVQGGKLKPTSHRMSHMPCRVRCQNFTQHLAPARLGQAEGISPENGHGPSFPVTGFLARRRRCSNIAGNSWRHHAHAQPACEHAGAGEATAGAA